MFTDTTTGLQIAAQLLTVLKQKKINFAHWKGNSHLLESLKGDSDVELLLKPEDRGAFEAVMNELNFKKARSQPWNLYPHIEDWIGFDDSTGSLLHLHTHYALIITASYRNYIQLPWLHQFFDHLIIDPTTGWPIPKPALEALILLIRLKIKAINMPGAQHKVYQEKKEELLFLLSRVQSVDFRLICDSLKIKLPADFHNWIDAIVKTEEVRPMIAFADLLFKQLPARIRKRHTYTYILSLYYKYYLRTSRFSMSIAGPVRLKKGIIRGGKVIALVGSDGSGKSSLSHDITKWLTFKIDTHYFYMGKLPFIKSYGKDLYFGANFIAGSNLISKVSRKLLGNIYHVFIIKQKSDLLDLAQQLSSRGSIVICDRFPQKSIYGINDGPKIHNSKNTWMSCLELKYFDQITSKGADLVFRLQVSPEVAHHRKPEHSYAMLQQKCESLKDIYFDNSEIIDLDANMPYEQVLLSLKREIWSRL